ncbi:polysaccharide deacetylase family protein [Sphingomonas pituitosa]|uniref:polysaccharide deacetylase family protein n=1 Tax=Sphingomonas pituitosa TaxID=99597 RepID=UPI0008329EE9|nr:polysaccharide deacetylase family protein [Sphingomonas pituitosa]
MHVDRRRFATGLATLVLASGPAAAAPTAAGAVSITYDDGLPSHLDVAVPALERRGLRGTFYVTLENIAQRIAEWARLPGRGHELGAHTVHHPCNISPFDAKTFADREFRPLDAWLDRVAGPGRARDFAFPCDVTDLGAGTPNVQRARYEAMLRGLGMQSGRNSEGPPNPAAWARLHPFRLQALAIGYDATPLDVFNYLQRARAERRWAILVFHQIGSGPESDGAVTAVQHDLLLDMVLASGLATDTVGMQMRRLASG